MSEGFSGLSIFFKQFFSVTAVLYVLLIYLYLTLAISPPLRVTEPFARERRGKQGLLLLGILMCDEGVDN